MLSVLVLWQGHARWFIHSPDEDGRLRKADYFAHTYAETDPLNTATACHVDGVGVPLDSPQFVGLRADNMGRERAPMCARKSRHYARPMFEDQESTALAGGRWAGLWSLCIEGTLQVQSNTLIQISVTRTEDKIKRYLYYCHRSGCSTIPGKSCSKRL